MCSGVTIRRGVVADAARLAPFAAQVFYETFASHTSVNGMAEYLKTAFTLDRWLGDLANSDNAFLVAEYEDGIVGYSKLAFASDEEPECVTGPDPVVELERVYVAHEWHGKGVADLLMHASLEESQRRGSRTMWLGVLEQNTRACRFYARWGFIDVGEHTFHIGDEAQIDRVMARDLNSGLPGQQNK